MTQLSDLKGAELLEAGQRAVEQSRAAEVARSSVPALQPFCEVCGNARPVREYTLEECKVDRWPEPLLHKVVGNKLIVTLPCKEPGCVATQTSLLTAPVAGDYERKLREAGIGALNMQGLTIEKFQTGWPKEKHHKDALVRAVTQIEAWAQDPTGTLVLSGPFGCGKTRLAVGALRKYLRANGNTGFHFACVEGWISIKAFWNTGEPVQYRDMPVTESDLFGWCQRRGLVVLDDVDKVTVSAAYLQWLLSIVNYRADRGVPTIITLNQPYKNLLPFLQSGRDGQSEAGALWSRLQSAQVLQFPADQPDYRARVAQGST